MKLSTATALLALMLTSSAPLAQQGAGSDSARIEAFKTSVTNGVEARRKLAQVMTDTVFRSASSPTRRSRPPSI
jgi:hypothetical protein